VRVQKRLHTILLLTDCVIIFRSLHAFPMGNHPETCPSAAETGIYKLLVRVSIKPIIISVSRSFAQYLCSRALRKHRYCCRLSRHVIAPIVLLLLLTLASSAVSRKYGSHYCADSVSFATATFFRQLGFLRKLSRTAQASLLLPLIAHHVIAPIVLPLLLALASSAVSRKYGSHYCADSMSFAKYRNRLPPTAMSFSANAVPLELI
jgi:hypothetical protein